jgi:sucrose-6-phosphate hydrolase SacC (GH32 family)
MGLPRVMSLTDQNELQTEPIAAVSKLRGPHTGLVDSTNSSNVQRLIDEIQIRDLCAEIDLQFQPKTDEFKFRLLSESGDFATISCTSRSGQRELRVNELTAPLAGDAGSPVRIHLFLDGSVLEIFANGTTALTARIYQIPTGPIRLRFDGDPGVKSLDVWQMQPISKDRLTGSLCS